MRFLIDMPLSPQLIGSLQEDGHNVVHASQIGLGSATDEQIISQARAREYIIITADLDYARLMALTGSETPGIILLRGGNYSEIETSVLIKRVLNIISPEQISNSIVVVDKKSIRRRQLPIE